MNYFGHVAVACRFLESPEFLLGSMLPDLAGIIGTSVPKSTADVQLGVQFHVRTDEVFHELAPFRQRVNSGSESLRSRGLRKGPARAVAHVATELLLDSELNQVQLYRVAYSEALFVAGPKRVGALLQWEARGTAEDFEFLRLRLIERSAFREPFAPGRLVGRLERVLKDRPRLRLTPNERLLVHDWLRTGPVPFGAELSTFVEQIEYGVRSRWGVRATVYG
jgi:hypothetical protein